jgi:DNA-binding response OmpR family regulator
MNSLRAMTVPRPQIAVIDEDPLFMETLAANLRAGGYRVTTYPGVRSILAGLAEGLRPLAVLVEARQADRDHGALPRALRGAGFAGPIILMRPEPPARSGNGADWIAKTLPAPMILHHLKRLIGPTAADMAIGDLGLTPAHSEITWRGHTIPVSPAEFAITAVLAAHAGVTVGYREIFQVIRGELFVGAGDADSHRMLVRAAVERLRRKFVEQDPTFDALEHETGLGYRWRFAAKPCATGGDIGRLYN